jgi:hypothetical protein
MGLWGFVGAIPASPYVESTFQGRNKPTRMRVGISSCWKNDRHSASSLLGSVDR